MPAEPSAVSATASFGVLACFPSLSLSLGAGRSSVPHCPPPLFTRTFLCLAECRVVVSRQAADVFFVRQLTNVLRSVARWSRRVVVAAVSHCDWRRCVFHWLWPDAVTLRSFTHSLRRLSVSQSTRLTHNSSTAAGSATAAASRDLWCRLYLVISRRLS